MSELISYTPITEVKKHFNRKAVGLAVSLAIVSSVASGCDAKTKTQYGGDVDMGNLPSDICMVDNRPLIYGVSTQSDGDIVMTYIRNDGATVAKLYTQGGLNTNVGGFKEGGDYIWKGNSCPTK